MMDVNALCYLQSHLLMRPVSYSSVPIFWMSKVRFHFRPRAFRIWVSFKQKWLPLGLSWRLRGEGGAHKQTEQMLPRPEHGVSPTWS